MERLNREGRYHCLYVNVEGAQSARGDVTAGITTIVQNIAAAASRYLDNPRLIEWVAALSTRHTAHGLLQALLENWSQASDKPIVLLLDEVDALIGDTLISLLRQIRAGYAQRAPTPFRKPSYSADWRDVRDYRIHTSGQRLLLGLSSAFNIKAESLQVGQFQRR